MIKLDEFRVGDVYHINAYDGEEMVGRLAVNDKGDNKAYITYVITEIKHTGKGIATMLLNRAIEVFKGCEIKLLVRPMPRTGEKIEYRYIKGLEKFYEKFGFERTDDPCLPTMILKNQLK